MTVEGVDVVDLHLVGPSPRLFDGQRLPFGDRAFDAGLMLFVLQYSEAPGRLLAEARRVISGPLVVIQTTASGARTQGIHALRSFFQGRFAYELSSFAGLVSAHQGHALMPKNAFGRDELFALFDAVGYRVASFASEPGMLSSSLGVSRDLFVLEAQGR